MTACLARVPPASRRLLLLPFFFILPPPPYFLWRLRPSKSADDDDTVLSTLAANLQTRPTPSPGCNPPARAQAAGDLYALAAWSASVYLCARSAGARVAGAPDCQVWYNQKGNAKGAENAAGALKRRPAKVEEINFYSTLELLAWCDASTPSSPQQQRPLPL
ncbi:hypothetical protein C8R44DRAFT_895640 [Mycena epipterygia]|nr:hypothetical protein C8R44DRAFT_895640 [Mycena epipterygia]